MLVENSSVLPVQLSHQGTVPRMLLRGATSIHHSIPLNSGRAVLLTADSSSQHPHRSYQLSHSTLGW